MAPTAVAAKTAPLAGTGIRAGMHGPDITPAVAWRFPVVPGERLLWPQPWTNKYAHVSAGAAHPRRFEKESHLVGNVCLEGRPKDPDAWPALSYASQIPLSAVLATPIYIPPYFFDPLFSMNETWYTAD